jgi:hypothetical protein
MLFSLSHNKTIQNYIVFAGRLTRFPRNKSAFLKDEQHFAKTDRDIVTLSEVEGWNEEA